MVQTFERIASNVVRACPFWQDTAAGQSKASIMDDNDGEGRKLLHYPGAITATRLEVLHQFKVFCSPHNEGAAQAVRKLLLVVFPAEDAASSELSSVLVGRTPSGTVIAQQVAEEAANKCRDFSDRSGRSQSGRLQSAIAASTKSLTTHLKERHARTVRTVHTAMRIKLFPERMRSAGRHFSPRPAGTPSIQVVELPPCTSSVPHSILRALRDQTRRTLARKISSGSKSSIAAARPRDKFRGRAQSISQAARKEAETCYRAAAKENKKFRRNSFDALRIFKSSFLLLLDAKTFHGDEGRKLANEERMYFRCSGG